ncbi:MAG: C4-dicarboxylate ABC transporter, partial [Serpentinimonas sp.]|nr:C4-dicarboxylate ABC transporter [Serpentinimonas sp.]
IMAMNQRRYESLPPDLRRVIDANSGLETSALFSRVQQAGDAPARQTAVARGNRINTIGQAESQAFRRIARQVEVEWVQDMDRRGFNGRELLANARRLIQKHSRA